VHMPAGALRPGTSSVYFDFETLYTTPAFLTALGDPCGFSLVATSAGQEVGDFGRIYLNGSNVSPNARGYNVAAIRTADQMTVQSFDTHLDPSASDSMAAFLKKLPPGQLIAVAAADEASMNLGDSAVDALHHIGAQTDLRTKFRWSHAVIGTTDAASNTALEAESELAPVTVSLGPAITEPEVAAAFRWIRFDAD